GFQDWGKAKFSGIGPRQTFLFERLRTFCWKAFGRKGSRGSFAGLAKAKGHDSPCDSGRWSLAQTTGVGSRRAEAFKHHLRRVAKPGRDSFRDEECLASHHAKSLVRGFSDDHFGSLRVRHSGYLFTAWRTA